MGVHGSTVTAPLLSDGVTSSETSVNNGNRTILKQAEYVGITCTST